MLPTLPTVRDADGAWAEVASALFAIWALRTGRQLRSVPVSQLTARELEDFWADDQSLQDQTPTESHPSCARR